MTRPTRTVTRNRYELPSIDWAGTEWQTRAACAGRDPSLWDFDFPDEWRKGAAICASCPVKEECLTAALSEEAGGYGRHARAMIRGGLTPAQRSRIAAGKQPGDAKPASGTNAPQWPTGEPCVECGTPLVSERAHRRDRRLRDHYGRHVGHGLCLNCWRKAHGRHDGPRKQVSA